MHIAPCHQVMPPLSTTVFIQSCFILLQFITILQKSTRLYHRNRCKMAPVMIDMLLAIMYRQYTLRRQLMQQNPSRDLAASSQYRVYVALIQVVFSCPVTYRCSVDRIAPRGWNSQIDYLHWLVVDVPNYLNSVGQIRFCAVLMWLRQ